MDEVAATEVAVGDEVRVHFHPPGPMKSFFEGVVRRAELAGSEGRFFTVEVTYEVILDREHRIRPGFHDYVRYECPSDFPGRIEILSTTTQDREAEPAPVHEAVLPPEEAEQEAEQEANEPHPVELEAYLEPEIEQTPEAETDVETAQADVEPQPARTPRGLMAALFGWKG
jgi:hypothetical protein